LKAGLKAGRGGKGVEVSRWARLLQDRGRKGDRLEVGGGDDRRAKGGGERERGGGEEGWVAGRDWAAWAEREKGVWFSFFSKPFQTLNTFKPFSNIKTFQTLFKFSNYFKDF
jgi:hypothetical protein